MKTSSWSVSGLCVTTMPERIDEVEAMLRARPGIEVHGRDCELGRLVVTQERKTVAEHQDGLRALQTLPGVLAADLVIHYSDRDPPTGDA